MSTYKCQNCGWRWRDSSFFEGVTCPKCTSNVKDLIEEPLHQSEAPSVDSQIERMIDRLDPFNISHNDFEYLKPRIMAKINRLITEAELKGFNIAFDCHDYDRLRDYKQALSNNLSKGDGDGRTD